MTRMPHLPLMRWNFRDQLQATSTQVVNNGGKPEITHYVYDTGGQRVRKVTENEAAAGQTPTRMKERIYLGGFEIYREYENDGDTVKLERETLHVMDDTQRIALIETRTDTPVATALIRYQFGNHLGSASLELNDSGQIISYEEYCPYGSTSYQAVRGDVEISPKRYRYTGMEKDEETGLNYHTERYYLPWLARWLSPDPIGLADGPNSYIYVGDNPILLIDRNGQEGTIPLKSDVFREKGFKKKTASYDNLTWSNMTKRHAAKQAAAAKGRSSSPSAAPRPTPSTTPVPASDSIKDRVVHVRVNDFAHPLGNNAILQAVTMAYEKIGITADVQFGSFLKADFGRRRDNIEITMLSPNVDAADQKLIRDAYLGQGFKNPTKHVATVVESLSPTDIGGFAGVFDRDPLAGLIFVKEMDAATRGDYDRVFNLLYPNDRAAAAQARDVYYYSNILIHELGHTFGEKHSNDTRHYMYLAPTGQPSYDRLSDILNRTQLTIGSTEWRQWVLHELTNSEPIFPQDQIDRMKNTIRKFVPKSQP